MSVQSEIDRITAAKAAIGTAIAGKGVAVPSGTKLDGMAALIANIEQGGGSEEKITIESLAIGTEIYLMEDALTPYILIAKDHHGAGLVTLIRKCATAEYSPYHYNVPSSTSGNKYDGSTLESAYDSFYAALPEETKSKIRLIDIEARANAGSSTVGKISARVFPLSEMEYAGTGSAEGSYIPYFARDEQRIAYDETGTPVIIWTRSVTGGMNNFCRIISMAGSTGNQTVPTAGYLRPACCIDSTVTVTKDGNGNYVLGGGSGGSGGGSVETCKVIIGGGGMLLPGLLGYAYTTLDDNGQIVSKTATFVAIKTPHEITCLVNSIFWVRDNTGGGPGFPDMLQFTGCELVKHFDKDASLLVKLTCGAGETASIR